MALVASLATHLGNLQKPRAIAGIVVGLVAWNTTFGSLQDSLGIKALNPLLSAAFVCSATQRTLSEIESHYRPELKRMSSLVIREL